MTEQEAKFKETLRKKIAEFMTTLTDAESKEWHCTDYEIGETVLRAFYWMVAPELKPKDLPSWEEFPLRSTGGSDGRKS